MPFTIAHTVIAPLISRLSKSKLPIAAIAIGSMSPDLYRLFSNTNNLNSHTWSAILFPNLLIGLTFCLLWYSLYRPVIYDFLHIQDDIQFNDPYSFIQFLIFLVLSLILGNITHIIWDGLTHLDARTLIHFEFFNQSIHLLQHSFSIHFVLQIFSSLLPLPIITWMIFKYYKRYHQPLTQKTEKKHFIYFTIVFCFIISCLFTLNYVQKISTEMWYMHTYYFLGRILNKFTQACLVGLSIIFLIYKILLLKKNR